MQKKPIKKIVAKKPPKRTLAEQKADLREVLVAEITGLDKAFILAHPEVELDQEQQQQLQSMQQQLDLGMPLAYILSKQWFMKEQFVVNPDVLIPRPETELLVEISTNWARKNQPKLIADIGTGSGAILISIVKALASHNPSKSLGDRAKLLATDISPAALKIAQQNAENILGSDLERLNIKFVKGNLAEPLEKLIKSNKLENILITANLPYLSEKELAEPTIKFEPRLAQFGGVDSFDKIAELLEQLGTMQTKYKMHFQNTAIFLEMNYNQTRIAKQNIKKHLPKNANVKIFKDLSGWPRVIGIYF